VLNGDPGTAVGHLLSQFETGEREIMGGRGEGEGKKRKGEVKRGSCKGEKEGERSGKEKDRKKKEGGGRLWKD